MNFQNNLRRNPGRRRKKMEEKRIPFMVDQRYLDKGQIWQGPQNAYSTVNSYQPYQPYKENLGMQLENVQMLDKQHFREQEEIRLLQEKSRVEIEKTVLKEHYLNQERMDLAQKKLRLNEYVKEARKANYDELIIKANGELSMQTKNLFVNVPPREISNFRFYEIYKLRSSNGDGGIYLLILLVNSNKTKIYLDSRKAGKSNYLMEKVTEAKGVIYANRPMERQNILLGFWIKSLSLCKKEKVIPANTGWIRDEENIYKFVPEGTLLWEDIMKKSK